MEAISNINDVIFSHYFFIGSLFLSYLVYRIVHSLYWDNNFMQTKYKARGHTWRSIQCNKSIPYNIHCTMCKELMLPMVGLFCECCAISACRNSCYKLVNKKLKCRPVTWPTDQTVHHHWVVVSSAQNDNICEGEDSITKYFCCWCQRTKVCRDSEFNLMEQCDFKKYKNIIIPPNNVLMENGVVSNIKPLQDDNWQPLIVFANRKSGSNRSDEVLSLFRGLLNPIQAIDLNETTPEKVVRWLPPRCRLLAAGGDGTVAWLLNALEYAPNVKAAVGILPMGTGNDLSRVLGWGATCDSHLDAHSIIASLKDANETWLDRWKITIRPKRRRLGRRRPERVLYAYNYASIGVDAQVALDFHRTRTHYLFQYANRTLNYITYVFLGANRAFDDGGCEGLEQRVSVRADGEPLAPLPPLQALVLLNIPSWGAGVDLWNMGNHEGVGEQSINDGKLEIVGISSSFHIARLQCGLAEPYRFTQASRIEIEMEGSCAMQVDGEPWMQGAASICVEPAGQRLVLRAPPLSLADGK